MVISGIIREEAKSGIPPQPTMPCFTTDCVIFQQNYQALKDNPGFLDLGCYLYSFGHFSR